MADKDLTVHLKADDKLSPAAKKAADELKKLEKPVDVTIDADVSGAIRQFDDLLAEVKQIDAAADALGRALGPELAAKADTRGIVVDLRQMGVTLDQIKGNADQFGAKLKELSDADVGGKLGANLGTTRGKLDQMAASAGSSKSVLANMVGNATQDVGALGGVAGSAGVAIGQMGEYMADAAANGDKFGDIVRNFGTVAGPIAAIAVGTQLISEAMASAKKSTQAHKDAVEDWTDAMREGGDVTDAYVDNLRESGEVQGAVGKASLDSIGMMGSLIDKTAGLGKVIGEGAEMFGLFGDEVRDITPDLASAGIGVDRWATLVAGSGEDVDKLRSAMEAAGVDAKTMDTILTALTGAQKDHAAAVKADAEFVKVFGDGMEKASDATLKNLAAVFDSVAAYRDERDALEESTDARASTIAGIFSEVAAVRDLIAVIQENIDLRRGLADSEFAYRDAQRDFTKAIGETSEALKANGPATLEGAAALDDFAQSAGKAADSAVRLEADQMSAAGATQSATQAQQTWNGAMITSARTTSGPMQKAIIDYIATVNGIPPEKVSEILADPNYQTIDAAKAALDAAAADQTAAIVAEAETAQAERDLAQAARDRQMTIYARMQAAGGGGGTSRPGGAPTPDMVPMVAATGAATGVAPVSTPVPLPPIHVTIPAPTPSSVTIQTGIIGNRFDSQRVLVKALRAHQRLNGLRE